MKNLAEEDAFLVLFYLFRSKEVWTSRLIAWEIDLWLSIVLFLLKFSILMGNGRIFYSFLASDCLGSGSLSRSSFIISIHFILFCLRKRLILALSTWGRRVPSGTRRLSSLKQSNSVLSFKIRLYYCPYIKLPFQLLSVLSHLKSTFLVRFVDDSSFFWYISLRNDGLELNVDFYHSLHALVILLYALLHQYHQLFWIKQFFFIIKVAFKRLGFLFRVINLKMNHLFQIS